MRKLLIFIGLCLSLTSEAQTYTFECVSGSRLTGDSCDICPTTIVESRSFNGLVIYRDSAFYRWVDQPYSIRVKPGGIVEYWEHSVNPYSERITIPLSLTDFFTVQGMADSTWCNSTAPNRAQLLGLDSIAPTDYALVLSGDNTDVVLRAGSNITLSIDPVGDTLTISGGAGGGGGTANNGVSDNEDGGKIRLGNRYFTSPDAPFTMDRGINIDGRVLSIGDLSDSTLLTIEGSTDRIGVGIATPQRKLDINGEVRIRDLITDTPIKIVGADADGDLGAINIGTNLIISGGDLNVTGITNQLLRDDGVDKTKRTAANFVSTATIAASLTDDAINDETEIRMDVVDNSISNAKIRQGVARSVIGVTGNATANVADIQGTTDQVLRVNTAGNALAFGQVATGGIADDAVTYAKLQNVVANNVVLGNITGANSNAQELTKANLQTLIGLTGVANRFALWTTATDIGSDAAFTFDGANDRATFTGTVAGVGANTGILNLNSGAIAGATTFLRCSGNINGNMIAEVVNSNNSNAANHTLLTLSSGGSSSGDAAIQFTVSGAMTHAIGIDNTDDRLKMTPNSATPGGNADMGVIVRDNAGLGNTGINIDFPTFPLTVKGRARLEEFIGEGNLYAAGNVAFGAGAGTGPTLTTIVGTNNMVMVRFTTGTTPTANGDVFTITYPLSYPTKSGVTFSAGCDGASAAAGDNAATDHNKFKISQSITTNFVFKAVGTLSASTAYAFTFTINGY